MLARLRMMGFGPTALAIVAGLGLAVAVQDFIGDDPASQPLRSVPEASGGRPAGQTSFLARLIPPPPEEVEGPAVPTSLEDLAERLPLERKVAQLFLLGFDGQDLTDPVFEAFRRDDVGGLVVEARNYLSASQVASLTGEAAVIAEQEGHVPPWALVSQEGGDFSELPDLPPARAPSELGNAGEAAVEAANAAAALVPLGFNGVLAPVIDVGTTDGSGALDERAFSDSPQRVAAFTKAVVGSYGEAGVLTAPKHFPGLGAASQPPENGPAQVGLSIEELEERDLRPFEAAFRKGAPAVVVGHGSYTTDDFVTPGSLSKAIANDLLREQLGFEGVAISDDLASPAITAISPIPDAAIEALRAGIDLVWISGPRGEQEAAYNAVLNAARAGKISRARIDQALLRSLTAKRDLGLIKG